MTQQQKIAMRPTLFSLSSYLRSTPFQPMVRMTLMIGMRHTALQNINMIRLVNNLYNRLKLFNIVSR